MFIGIKEQEVLINNYSKIVAILNLSFKNMIPHFISKRLINFDEQSKITVADLLKKILAQLKDGDTSPFYDMLNIMKVHGNASDEQLATTMEENLSLKQ